MTTNEMHKEIITEMMENLTEQLDAIQEMMDDGLALFELSYANMENAAHAYNNAQSYMIYLMKQQQYVYKWLAELNVELIRQAIRLEALVDGSKFQFAIEREDGMFIGPATLNQFRLMHWEEKVAILTVVSHHFTGWAE